MVRYLKGITVYQQALANVYATQDVKNFIKKKLKCYASKI